MLLKVKTPFASVEDAIAFNIREARTRASGPVATPGAESTATSTLTVPAELHSWLAKLAAAQRMTIPELLERFATEHESR